MRNIRDRTYSSSDTFPFIFTLCLIHNRENALHWWDFFFSYQLDMMPFLSQEKAHDYGHNPLVFQLDHDRCWLLVQQYHNLCYKPLMSTIKTPTLGLVIIYYLNRPLLNNKIRSAKSSPPKTNNTLQSITLPDEEIFWQHWISALQHHHDEHLINLFL